MLDNLHVLCNSLFGFVFLFSYFVSRKVVKQKYMFISSVHKDNIFSEWRLKYEWHRSQSDRGKNTKARHFCNIHPIVVICLLISKLFMQQSKNTFFTFTDYETDDTWVAQYFLLLISSLISFLSTELSLCIGEKSPSSRCGLVVGVGIRGKQREILLGYDISFLTNTYWSIEKISKYYGKRKKNREKEKRSQDIDDKSYASLSSYVKEVPGWEGE